MNARCTHATWLALLVWGSCIALPRAVCAVEESPPLASSRDLLALLGVLDRLDGTSDDAELRPEGDDLIWRMLYAVRRFTLLDLHRWAQPGTADEVRDHPSASRGAVVTWKGTVIRASVHKLPSEVAELFVDMSRYYRCELESPAGAPPVVIYSLAIPKTWRLDEALRERAEVQGLFVRLAESDHSPVIVARRVAWHPATLLGDLDMDIGLFDDLSGDSQLTGDDRECFYELLAATGRIGTRQLSRAVTEEGRNASVIPLFKEPNQQRGRLIELTGTARQAVERRVEDADIVARFGIDHYYEMELFTDDSQGNPLTFCVRDLPKDFPKGSKITEPVRVAGFFFKLWGYRQSDAAQNKPNQVRRQLSPLLIGRQPIWLETPAADQRFANGVFLVLLVVLTIVAWLVVMMLARGDRRFFKQVAGRFMPPPSGSLNELNVHDSGQPTFGETEAHGERHA